MLVYGRAMEIDGQLWISGGGQKRGEEPCRTGYLVSHDNGDTWPEWQTVCTGLQDEIHCTNTTSVNLQGSDDVTVGETLFSDGNIQDAVSVFQTTLSRNPAQAQARGNLSCACWEMGWHPRALVEGVLAAGSDPDNETLSLNLQDMLAVEAN